MIKRNEPAELVRRRTRAEEGALVIPASASMDGPSDPLACALKELQTYKEVHEARARLLAYARSHSLDEVMEKTLDEVEKITGSVIGFYHFVDPDQKSLTLQNWSTRTKNEFCKALGSGSHYQIAQAGVWVDCVRQRKPVIHNDYASLPHRKGLPPGHAAVIRELVVPVIKEGMIVAILGVGNKPTDYGEQDVTTVSLFAELIWDITERKKAEELMQKNLDVLNEIGSTAKIGGWALDVETGVPTWTDETFRIFEIEKTVHNEPRLTEGVAFYAPASMPIIEQAVLRAIEYGESYDLDLELITMKGNHRWVHTTGKAYQENGETKRLAGIIQDITERKQAEQREKELREKLERAARMESLGVLAGGVAHDLNNVLGPMVMLPELIAEYVERCGDLADPEHEDTLESIQAVKASAARASAMVSDLVVMGRRGQFHQVPVNVNKVVAQLLDSKQVKAMQAKRPDVQVSKELLDDPLWCIGSDSRLLRVLANLVGNAAEAIDGQGDVTVRTGRQVLTKLQHGYEDVPAGDYVTIEVEDTGCGIDAKTLTRMFEPFYSTKTPCERSGSGLGLSVVSGLVKDHAGFLDVKSEPGKGTMFTIYLPSASAGDVAAVSDVENLPGGHEKILVVDDEPGQQFLSRRALKKLGYNAETVSSGEDAVALFGVAAQGCKSAPFDLVMMDMIMKGVDGLSACKTILKLFPKQRILIVSGHAPDNLVAEVKALGLDWLHKPYAATDLARTVRASLDR